MRTPSRALAVGAALALFLTACGDDDDEAATDDTTETTADTGTDDSGGDAEPSMLEVTLTADGLELSGDEIAGGVVDVTFVNETDGYADVDFTHVDDGTTEDQFTEAFAVVFSGGPFPDFTIDNAGIGTEPGESITTTVELDAGEYIVWSLPEEGGGPDEGESEGPAEEGAEEDAAGDEPATDPAAGGEAEAGEGEGEGSEGEGPPPEAFLTTTLTVTEPLNEAAFPETDGTITAKDYGFEVEAAGPGTYTFVNEGPVQWHHAVIADFGTNDPEVVREKMPELLEGGEGAPPPEGLDAEQINFDFAGSGVFGPGGKGTFDVDFEPGNTYALVCFIQDQSGGAPHAIAHDMYEVFQAG